VRLAGGISVWEISLTDLNPWFFKESLWVSA
jgi:hypothetical protein